MSRRAMGLCLIGAVVLVHGAVGSAAEPALENQRVAEPRQDAGAEHGQDEPAQEKPEPSQIELALKAIETAIRDLIAEEDAIERKRQQQREVADLQAQQEMALWAERMTWATWGASV
jgi:hypothetical protein